MLRVLRVFRRCLVPLALLAAVGGCAADRVTGDDGGGDTEQVVVAPVGSLTVGSTRRLTAQLVRNGRDTAVTTDVVWTSENPAVATISDGNLLTAVSVGQAYVTADNRKGKKGRGLVRVDAAAISAVRLNPTALSLTPGRSTTVSVQIVDANGASVTGRQVAWASSDTTVAVVSAGTVTARRTGTASIAASVDGVTGTAQVVVADAPVASVTVTLNSSSIAVPQQTTAAAVLRDAQGAVLTGRSIGWSSSNAAVATVDANGLVRAVSAGTASITASSEGITGSATVTVTAQVAASIVLQPASFTVTIGGAQTIQATVRDGAGNTIAGRQPSWSSANPAVASVDAAGVVRGVAFGSTTITATADGATAQASVTVVPTGEPLPSVTPATATVLVGGTTQLTAQMRDAAGNPVSATFAWQSGSPGVATVSSAGLVTGVAAGTATISATADGKTASATITVTPVPVASVSIAPTSLSLVAGQTGTLAATCRDASGNALAGRTVTWASSATSVATINAVGLVTAVAQGSATMTATCEGRTATAAVTVTPVPVASVAVTPASSSLQVGGTLQLTATLRDAAGNTLTGRTVTWTSSAASVATVSNAGLVTAVGAGTVTITASSGGVNGTASLTITAPPPAPVASVTVAPGAPSVQAGTSTQLSVTLRDASNTVLTGRTVTWSSANTAVATVSGSGLVTGVAAGTVTITATSEGVNGSANVTVTPAGTGGGSVNQPGVVSLACPATQPPAVPAPARTFYVDGAMGNDANAGSSTAPWRTVDRANGAVQPGDIVYLRGTFTAQYIRPGRSGTASAKITYAVWPGGSAVIENGRDGTGIYLTGQSHIVVNGIELRGIAYPIQLVDGANNNWLRNLYVHSGGAIFIEGASDNRLEDSRIERCGNESSNSGDCVWLAYGANRNVIARNVMRYGGHALLSVGGDKAGRGTSDDNVVYGNDIANGWANNMSLIGFANRTIVECNRIHHATTESTINYSRAGLNVAASNNIIRYNLVYDNEADAIQLQSYPWDTFLQQAHNNQVYNNTFFNNGGAAVAMSAKNNATLANNVFSNNIFWNNNRAGANDRGRYYNGQSYDIWMDHYVSSQPWPAGSLNGNAWRNNIIGNAGEAGRAWMLYVSPNGTANRSYTLAQAEAAHADVRNNLESDPLLDAALKLMAGSPAIDRGLQLFSGHPFTGAAPDLGAQER